MADVVNLNQFRKAKARADKTKTAEENRVKFGRRKADKNAVTQKLDKQSRDLDGKIVPDNSDN